MSNLCLSYINNIIYNYPFFFSIFIMLIGLLIILYSDNLIKKVFGLNIFQTSVITFYISISHIHNGRAPIINNSDISTIYVNPLPQVLMLTAIVVGISLTAVAFALIVKIKQNYNTISESAITNIIKQNQ